MGPDDDTPPEGLPAQRDTPTDPQIPVAKVLCYECSGAGKLMTVHERNPDGSTKMATLGACPICQGTRYVTRTRWKAYITKLLLGEEPSKS